MSKNSAWNSTLVDSVILVVFTKDMSQFVWKGPRKTFRPRFPKAAKPVLLASEHETMTFWLLTHRPPTMKALRLTKLSMRDLVLPEVRMVLGVAPGARVAKLVVLTKSVSCKVTALLSKIIKGVPDCAVYTP